VAPAGADVTATTRAAIVIAVSYIVILFRLIVWAQSDEARNFSCFAVSSRGKVRRWPWFSDRANYFFRLII
jgi:hypothetical protein